MALATTWFRLVHALRLAPALLFLLLLTFLFTFPLLWRWMKPGYLIPLFDLSQIDPYGKAFWVSLGVIRDSFFPVVFLPYVSEPKKAVRTLAWAHWVGWLGNFLAVVTPVMGLPRAPCFRCSGWSTSCGGCTGDHRERRLRSELHILSTLATHGQNTRLVK